jgi:transcription initiation factor TFIIIB Brf1 subunit/transcription initiation factor TFIIB
MKDESEMKRSVEIHVLGILAALGSSEAVQSMTTNLLKICDKYGILESRNPLGETAGIVYIAGILTNHPVTLAVIAKKAGMSPEIVRKFKTYLASELKTKKEWPGLPPKGK